MSLRLNLATRPFYNERLLHLGLAAAAVGVMLASVYNGAVLWTLSKGGAARLLEIRDAEARTGALRQEVARARSSADAARLEEIREAAAEANRLIDGRTFSWTDLLNRFEATLPDGVRITSIRPLVDQDGRRVITVAVVAREVGDIEAFMEALEQSGGFRQVLAREERQNDEGAFEASIRGVFAPATTGTTED